MDLKIKGKTAVITGGTKGIGAGIAEVFAAEGVNLALAFRSDAEGAESFGAKAVRIVGVSEEDREEASNALSLILVYHVYSASARRSRSFTINERTYSLVSSDKDSVSFVLDKK